MAKNVVGKPKDEEFLKEFATRAIQKKHPWVPKRVIRKGVDKSLAQIKKKGIGL